jgi:hypothetical protein
MRSLSPLITRYQTEARRAARTVLRRAMRACTESELEVIEEEEANLRTWMSNPRKSAVMATRQRRAYRHGVRPKHQPAILIPN